jgi:hypothetical protein
VPESTAKLLGLPGSFWTFQKPKKLPEAKSHELLGFWLMGAVLLLESPKASSLKMTNCSFG